MNKAVSEKQYSLPFDLSVARVEIIRMADPAGCYEVWIDYAEPGSNIALLHSDLIDPPPKLGMPAGDSLSDVVTYYWRSLKEAVHAARDRCGADVRIEVCRWQGSPHRPNLVLRP